MPISEIGYIFIWRYCYDQEETFHPPISFGAYSGYTLFSIYTIFKNFQKSHLRHGYTANGSALYITLYTARCVLYLASVNTGSTGCLEHIDAWKKDQYFSDDIIRVHFVDNKSSLLWVMAYHRTGDKSLPNSMMTYFTNHAVANRSQYVNSLRPSDAYMRQKANHHCLRWWLVAWSAPSHYLNQWWNIVNANLPNTFQWNRKQNSYIFIQENAFQNVVRKMAAILSRPQCVKHRPLSL